MKAESVEEALHLAAGHASLARSRGVGLDVVLTAALRGSLRDIVVMPARPPRQDGTAA